MEFGVNEILEVITIVIAMSRPLFSMLKTSSKKKKMKFSTQASRLCNNLDILPNSIFAN